MGVLKSNQAACRFVFGGWTVGMLVEKITCVRMPGTGARIKYEPQGIRFFALRLFLYITFVTSALKIRGENLLDVNGRQGETAVFVVSLLFMFFVKGFCSTSALARWHHFRFWC